MRARGPLLRRVRGLHPTLADGLLAALVSLLGLPQLFIISDDLAKLDVHFRSTDALAVLLTWPSRSRWSGAGAPPAPSWP